MKKKLLSTCIFILFASANCIYAQVDTVAAKPEVKKDTVWRHGASFGLNFSNVGLSNWAAGGQSMIAFTGIFSGNLDYVKKKAEWHNSLDIAYGFQRLGNASAPYRKSDDRIYFQTKGSYVYNKKLHITALADFRSQFAPGYVYYTDSSKLISNLLAPAYITGSLGAEYLPFKGMSIIFAPVALRYTIVDDKYLSSQGAFGVTPGQILRKEYGVSMMIKYKVDVVKNVTYSTQLYLFDNYKNINVDVYWDNFIYMKVNSFLTTTFSTNLIYDNSIQVHRDNGTVGPAIQFKHVLSVGLVYKLSGVGLR
jgi:hypothetical protein